jgi:allantoinase
VQYPPAAHRPAAGAGKRRGGEGGGVAEYPLAIRARRAVIPAGGVTTLIDMPVNCVPPTTTPAALRRKQAAARAQARADVGFWGGAVPGNLGALAGLHRAGVFGFKAFLVDSGVPEFGHLGPAGLDAALAELARLDALLIVHAEDPR